MYIQQRSHGTYRYHVYHYSDSEGKYDRNVKLIFPPKKYLFNEDHLGVSHKSCLVTENEKYFKL